MQTLKLLAQTSARISVVATEKSAPLKLLRAQNSKQQQQYLQNNLSIRGIDQAEVPFLSQNDKCKVLFNIIPINRDYVISPRHKFIPSVIGSMSVTKQFMNEDAVIYSRATDMHIRSAKHFGSNPYNPLNPYKPLQNLEVDYM